MKTWVALFFSLVMSSMAAEQDGAPSDPRFDPDVTAKAQSADTAKNQGSSLFPTPVIMVTPATLEFGHVAINTMATNTFLVENVGRGKVVGKATVSPPFKVLDGGVYSLTRKEKQVISIVYSPKSYWGSNDVRTISFSGAGVAEATVTGTPIRPQSGTNPARH